MLKPFRWDDKLRDWRYNMLVYFGLLTRDTFPGPLANVLFDVWPYEFFRDGLASPFDSWMSEAMDDVEDASPVREWNEWACRSIGNIDK